jgi:hypothetical protein
MSFILAVGVALARPVRVLLLESVNPKPYREELIMRHGLVKCNTRLWNRDTNAAGNIWKIAREVIGGRPIPLYLQRHIIQ